jgi:hypothetical protein
MSARFDRYWLLAYLAHTNAPRTQKSHENRPDGSVSHAESQRHEAPALDGTVPGKTNGLCRAHVRFTGYRVRPLDPDNFAGSVKDLLDGLCHARLIPGDETWRITLETQQVRVKHLREEKTTIEIEDPQP